MSFLAPLYLLAGLAIGLPVLFHMIRRTPKGRQVFSSVMFLTPSPPRMTKRSRIQDWLLLMLRAAAILLVAFAFARPFLRAQEAVMDEASGRERLAIVIDRSASMRRDGYWDQAVDQARDAISQVDARDAVCLIAFADEPETILSFDDWSNLDPTIRTRTVLERLEELGPGWRGTSGGDALIAGAEALEEDTGRESVDKTLVFISDMQSGGGWQQLDQYTWPEDVIVRVMQIGGDKEESNAAIQLVGSESSGGDVVRLRIMNSPTSLKSAFQIAWQDPITGEPLEPRNISVPAGESRVISAPDSESVRAANQLILTGDDIGFDNVSYLVRGEPRVEHIVYLGTPGTGDPADDLTFFLKPMFPSTPVRRVEIHHWEPQQDLPPIEHGIDLLILGGDIRAEQAVWIRDWIQQGGGALFVARNADQSMALYDVLDSAPGTVKEASVRNYAMLGEIDFQHPLLSVFADPRFSDFTKLRFWSYRQFERESLPEPSVLAGFDDGWPALVEMPLGEGRLYLLTSGWNRDDSDLAVWSKFVPLMNGLLESVSQTQAAPRRALVGQQVSLESLGLTGAEPVGRFRGEPLKLSSETPVIFEEPGIYYFADSAQGLEAGEGLQIAVNLDPEESRTDPVPIERLEASGIALATNSVLIEESHEERRSRQRQLMNQELESRQKMWRWLLMSAIGILLLESAIASWRAKPKPYVVE